jgi:hypothetical protein
MFNWTLGNGRFWFVMNEKRAGIAAHTAEGYFQPARLQLTFASGSHDEVDSLPKILAAPAAAVAAGAGAGYGAGAGAGAGASASAGIGAVAGPAGGGGGGVASSLTTRGAGGGGGGGSSATAGRSIIAPSAPMTRSQAGVNVISTLAATKDFQSLQAKDFPKDKSKGGKKKRDEEDDPEGKDSKPKSVKRSFRHDDGLTLESALKRDGVVKFETTDKSKPIKEAISRSFGAETVLAKLWISVFFQLLTTDEGDMFLSYAPKCSS